MSVIAIHWFRNDLRLQDNPALFEAALRGSVVPVWFDDPELPKSQKGGAYFRLWQEHALVALDEALSGTLRIIRGDPSVLLPRLVTKYQARVVTWNEVLEPAARGRDLILQTHLRSSGAEVVIKEATFLWEPTRLHQPDGAPFRHFEPFYAHALLLGAPRRPLGKPLLRLVPRQSGEQGPDPKTGTPSAAGILRNWEVGEAAAHRALNRFLAERLSSYVSQRDQPANQGTSRLSPFLAHGEISLPQIWAALEALLHDQNLAELRKELIRREFSNYLLYHFPKMVKHPMRQEFASFPWGNDAERLAAWQEGKTGYPLIDASLRKLQATGWLHGRLRQKVASFLCKNLLIDWRIGASWFRDKLVDHTTSLNYHHWQSAAGCAHDALPFYRFFNPVLQTGKLDPTGSFIRRWLPELVNLATPYLATPWLAPEGVLKEANVRLGIDYPYPIVDLNASRQEALAAFARTTGITA